MRVFLSFLGLGSPRRDADSKAIVDHCYYPASYRFPGQDPSPKTPYVQRAVLEALIARGETPDVVLIAMTAGSREWQWDKAGRLRACLEELQAMREPGRVVSLDISEDLSVDNQWTTFQAILEHVPKGCDLYVDLTHGFRVMPILFSTAIHFLTQVRQVRLAGAYYGAYEPRKEGPFPIVDMKDFFAVNRWAEAVRSVVEDANPTLMADLAGTEHSLQFSALEDEALIRGFQHLGSVLKNADTSSVAAAADDVVTSIARALEHANPASRVLLELALDKFQDLARDGGTERFSAAWYDVQLQMAKVLLDHGLTMQGLTVLRELVVSWGEEIAVRAMRDPDNTGTALYLRDHSRGKLRQRWIKNARQRVAEPFLARLCLGDEWDPREPTFDPDGVLIRGFLDAEYDRSFAARKANGEFQFLDELRGLRNVLNHGWTSKKADHAALGERGFALHEQVARLTRELIAERVLGREGE